MQIREILNRLDEISRRDFLKGAGAAAVGAAVGQPQDSRAEWLPPKLPFLVIYILYFLLRCNI